MDKLLAIYADEDASDPETVKYWEVKMFEYCLNAQTFSFIIEDFTTEHTIDAVFPTSFVAALRLLLNREDFNNHVVSKQYLLSDDVDVDVLESLLSAVKFWSGGLFAAKMPEKRENYIPVKLLKDVEVVLQQYLSTLEEADCVVFTALDSKLPLEFSFRGLLQKSSCKANSEKLKKFIAEINDEESNVFLHYLLRSKKVMLSNDGNVAKVIKQWRIGAHSHNEGNTPAIPDLHSVWNSIFGVTDDARYSSVTTSATKSTTATGGGSTTITETEDATLRLKCSIYQVEYKVEELRNKANEQLNKAKLCKVLYLNITLLKIKTCQTYF